MARYKRSTPCVLKVGHRDTPPRAMRTRTFRWMRLRLIHPTQQPASAPRRPDKPAARPAHPAFFTALRLAAYRRMRCAYPAYG